MLSHPRVAAAALAALLVHASAACAGTALKPSPLSLPHVDLASLGDPRLSIADGWCQPPVDEPTLGLTQVVPPAVEASALHYRLRATPEPSQAHETRSVSQIQLGAFDPAGELGDRFNLNIRGGPMVGDYFQVGVSVDWMYKTENVQRVISSTTGPGGVPISQNEQLARTSFNMFPMMAFAQLSLGDGIGIIPYAGLAGGYEVLLLSADDFITGKSFDGTFGGWGYQYWGGIGIPLGPRLRLNAEAYVNEASLGRNATDNNTGQAVRETVNGNGTGLRAGVAWGF